MPAELSGDCHKQREERARQLPEGPGILSNSEGDLNIRGAFWAWVETR